MLNDILKKLEEIEEVIDDTLRQESDFTIKTTSVEGVSYTHDREKYLELGLDIALEDVNSVIEDVREYLVNNA